MNGENRNEPRSDPFGLGLAAHGGFHGRETCPYPAGYDEGRRWLAGWDHAEIDKGRSAKRGQVRERPWSHGELIVLKTLVRSGETLASLSFRLRRTRTAIRDKCAIQMLTLSAAQEGS